MTILGPELDGYLNASARKDLVFAMPHGDILSIEHDQRLLFLFKWI